MRDPRIDPYDDEQVVPYPPTHPSGPRSIIADVPSRVLARDEPCADPANCDVHAPYVAAVDEAVEQLAERAKVPAWVLNPEKWQSLSRAERRATARHHEREQRRRRR
jgi:hypothetical protein